MKTFLKIKCKSLAAEAKIIRREEHRWPKGSEVRKGLFYHRILDVRRESRSACLAYGFLRGRSYKSMEAKAYTQPDWKRVQSLVEKYSGEDVRDVRQRFSAWKDA